jgi:amino acid adenylation domain-containing protein
MDKVVKSLPNIIDLSIEERVLLELRLKQKRESRHHHTVITRRKDRLSAPLSFAQQRLWFLNRLAPNNPVYNNGSSLWITGRLHIHALEGAINEIINRHEVLRATFQVIEGEPQQIVTTALPLKFNMTDLSRLPEWEREAEAQRIIAQDVTQPCNLEAGPLARYNLLRLNERLHILAFTMHHIISDGWSVGVFMRELKTLYQAFISGLPSPLAELPIQYADFAQWQREWLQGEVLEAHLDYWRPQLEGAPAVLQLPTDRPRPAVQRFRGAKQGLVVEAETTSGLKKLGREEGATLFMVLLAAFKVLLWRWSGEADVVVGTPMAGRTRAETESLIGFFVNTLVLRTRLRAEGSFRGLVGEVREVCLGAYAHQEVPFEKLVEELRPERSLSHTPLFQVMLILHNASVPQLELPGLSLSAHPSNLGVSKFEITLIVTEEEKKLISFLEYDTDLFDAVTIARMADHLQRLLAGVVAGPENYLAELPLLGNAEREQLIVEWNRTECEFLPGPLAHELFEAQAERTPEAIAVVCGDHQLTYQELNRSANRLADYLCEQGVGAETLVGLCLERSLEMIIGFLGILKSGGVYLPLDPDQPKERFRFMLSETAPLLILTGQSTSEFFTDDRSKLSHLDSIWSRPLLQDPDHFRVGICAENLAYLIYTSGSTGQPKAVMVEHGHLRHTLQASQLSFNIQAGDMTTVMAANTFDIWLLEVLLPLTVGGRLAILQKEHLLNLQQLVVALEQTDVVTYFPPSLLQEMVRYCREHGIGAEKWDKVRLIMTGGEAVSPELLARVGELFPKTEAIVLYGPTEGAIICSYYTQERTIHRSKPMIGRPLPNVKLRVYDSRQQLTPIGVAGELYLGGNGVSRGYFRSGDLTAEKYTEIDGERYYMTGDLVRYLPDGQLEFLGRTDEQVKIRGYRIELGEIEAALYQHAGVAEAVVVVREDGVAGKRLVAYLAGAGEYWPSVSELRAYLGERLPEYMIPATFIYLDRLPRKSNGKLDRRALVQDIRAESESRAERVKPRTKTEEMLVEIWAALMGLAEVGIHDNFFELGGHSLLATQLMTRVSEAMHTELPLRHLFASPTVAGLAEIVEQQQRGEEAHYSFPIAAVERGEKSLDELLEQIDELSDDEVAARLTDHMRLEQ